MLTMSPKLCAYVDNAKNQLVYTRQFNELRDVDKVDYQKQTYVINSLAIFINRQKTPEEL